MKVERGRARIRPGGRPEVPTGLYAALFAGAVFLGAFLLFQVQPLISKYILPWFGGSPSVWNSCLLFFQTVLFLGYAYAHLSVTRLGPRAQLAVHAGLVVLAAALLSIEPGGAWRPEGSENPVWWILRLLAATVGLPFFVLAGSAPLFQSWFGRLFPRRVPYRLYALSNAGSLLALLSFPFLFEPRFSSPEQATIWSALFVLFGLLAVACAAGTWLHGARTGRRPGPPADLPAGRAAARGDAPRGAEAGGARDGRPSGRTVGRPWQWMAWSACGVILFMAVTNRLCLDIAAIPFLWVLPLSVYLLTYIVAFSGRRFYPRRLLLLALLLVVPALVQVGSSHVKLAGLFFLELPTTVQIVVHIVALAVLDLICHGELYRLRPPPERLTTFYLCVAAGGSLGGMFVALLAPRIFPFYQELAVGALAVCALSLWNLFSEAGSLFRRGNARLRIGGTVAGFAVLAAFLLFKTGHLPQNAIFVERNFHGSVYVIRMNEGHPEHDRLIMRHGTTKHGAQYLKPSYRTFPTTYFSPFTGVGLAMNAYQQTLGEDRPMHVGIVGLGIGTLAAYARPEDRYRFYEIDPLVAEVAASRLVPTDPVARFTYVGACRGDVRIVIGDARLKMEQELAADPAGQRFDFLVLDAFSSDAIPVHLLTREAFEVYERHLKPDGVIALHISSNNFDLRPVCYQLAAENGFEASLIVNRRRDFADQPQFDCDLSLISSWVILYHEGRFLDRFQELARPLLESGEISGEKGSERLVGDFRPWTDSYTNLLAVYDP